MKERQVQKEKNKDADNSETRVVSFKTKSQAQKKIPRPTSATQNEEFSKNECYADPKLQKQLDLLNLNCNEKAKKYKSKSLFLEGGAYYEKPSDGSVQENLSDEQKLKLIKHFIPLRTMKEKEYLLELPTHKPWIRYYNLKSKQFRLGGLLCRVQFPDYIILMNYRTKVFWSVQLKDNIIYVSNKDYAKLMTPKQQEFVIKNKLFSLYKRGKLQLIGNESDDETQSQSESDQDETYDDPDETTYETETTGETNFLPFHLRK